MKIKCINNDNGWIALTIGETYEVTYIYKESDYEIINDNGYSSFYPKRIFKPLSEIRAEKIDKLLEDDS